MALKLFYITNHTEIAKIAQDAGVDRIFIDMEHIGKDERQKGIDTVKNFHTIEDVSKIRKCLTTSELLVRVNPIHNATKEYESSEDEIKRTIDAGADVIMLPMYKTVEDVERFVKAVDGRARSLLLNETPEACQIIDEVLNINEIDEIHIGLNDLHLSLQKKFIFQLLTDGTVESLTTKIKASGKHFGFGGIARLGYGTLPAERIIIEHYRLGSTMAILSRSFCNADMVNDINVIRQVFTDEIVKIREAEKLFVHYTQEQFEENRKYTNILVNNIVGQIQ